MGGHQHIMGRDEEKNFDMAMELQISLSKKWTTSSNVIQYYWRTWKPARRYCCLHSAIVSCGIHGQGVEGNSEDPDKKEQATFRRQEILLIPEFCEMVVNNDFKNPERLLNLLEDRTKSVVMQLSPGTDDLVGDMDWVKNNKSLATYHRGNQTMINQLAYSRMILSMDILCHVVDGLLFAITIDYDEDDFKKFLNKDGIATDLPSPEYFELEDDPATADTTVVTGDQNAVDAKNFLNDLELNLRIAPTEDDLSGESELPQPLLDTRQPLPPQGIDHLLYLYRTEPGILSHTVKNWHSNRPEFGKSQERAILTPGYSLDLFEVIHDAVREAASSGYIRHLMHVDPGEYQAGKGRESLRRRELWNVYEDKFHRAQALFGRYYQSELEQGRELESKNLALLVKLYRTRVGEAISLVKTIFKEPETLALMKEDEREAFNHLVETISFMERIRNWIGKNVWNGNNDNIYLSKVKALSGRLNKWKMEFVRARLVAIEDLCELQNASAALNDLNNFVMEKTHGRTMGHLYHEAVYKSLNEFTIQLELKKPQYGIYEFGNHYHITPKRSISTLPQEFNLAILNVHEYYFKNVWEVLFSTQSEGINFGVFRMAMEDVGFKAYKEYCGRGLVFFPPPYIKPVLNYDYGNEGLSIQEPHDFTFKNMSLVKLAAFLRTRLGWDIGWFAVRPVNSMS